MRSVGCEFVRALLKLAVFPPARHITARHVDLFDPKRYVTGPPRRDARWHVNFNGLQAGGTIPQTKRARHAAVVPAAAFDAIETEIRRVLESTGTAEGD